MDTEKRRIKISFNKSGCIGAGHCALADPFDFQLDDYGLADLKGDVTKKGPVQQVIIETSQAHLAFNAAKCCPAGVITVLDADTGKLLAPKVRDTRDHSEIKRLIRDDVKALEEMKAKQAANQQTG